MSRSLNPTRPCSMRLIFECEPRMLAAARSVVMPALFAEPAQVAAEHEALHCRARRTRAEQRLRGLLPGGVLGREHRYSSVARVSS